MTGPGVRFSLETFKVFGFKENSIVENRYFNILAKLYREEEWLTLSDGGF